ncbi:MAG: DUF2127 domain-containing protein [Rhodanobacteraceae bacterium]
MIHFQVQTRLDRAFAIGIGLKAVDAVIEIVGGLWLLFLHPEQLQDWAGIIFAPELREDPTDLIATHALHWAAHFKEGAVLFAAVYLLSHGVAKLVVVVEILRGRLWAYPGLIVLTSLFVVYQIYHMWRGGLSLSFVAMTLFDLLIIALTVAEYAKLRAHRACEQRVSLERET